MRVCVCACVCEMRTKINDASDDCVLGNDISYLERRSEEHLLRLMHTHMHTHIYIYVYAYMWHGSARD